MSFPRELALSLSELDKSVTGLEEKLQPLLNMDMDTQYHNMSSFDRVHHGIATMYTINSLFWVYLRCRGNDPQQHGVRDELQRVKHVMGRLSDLQQRASALRIDREAAKRVVAHSLWQPNQQQQQQKPKH